MFSFDGAYLAITSRPDPRQREGNTITVLEMATQAEIATITSIEHVSNLAFSPDGKLLATIGYGSASLALAAERSDRRSLRGCRAT